MENNPASEWEDSWERQEPLKISEERMRQLDGEQKRLIKAYGREFYDEVKLSRHVCPKCQKDYAFFTEECAECEVSFIDKFQDRYYEFRKQKENPPISLEELDVRSYYRNVKRFNSKQPFFYDKSGTFWFWLNGRYSKVDEVDILNQLDKKLGFNGETVNPRIKQSYLESFRRVGRDNIPLEAPSNWVQFKNKVYDIETSKISPVTPEYFFTNPIPHEIGSSEKTPVMDRIFREWVGDDYVTVLYEIIAYCCLTDYPLNRIFCLVGAGNNGKTSFLNLLNRFIGDENTTSTELDLLLSSRFEVCKLHRKLVALMGETDFTTMKKTSMLKKLSGKDKIGFEYKNKTPFEDFNYAKIMIATNNLPVTEDKTRGFYRRWFIIDFPNEFSEKKDILKDIPDYEYSNLAYKTISILKKLLHYREFTNEGTIQDRQNRYEEKSNTVNSFIKKYCIKSLEDSDFLPFTEFYSKFVTYCKEHKHRVLNAKMVGRLLGNEGFERVNRTSTISDDVEKTSTSSRVIVGLKWKELQQKKILKI